MTTVDVERVRVLSPVAERWGAASPDPLAPRLTTLEGTTLGLVWNAKPNGDVALKRAGELIAQRIPNVTVRFYSGSLPCEPDLLERAAAECDAFISCTAD
jgi:hypothetical protein